MDSAFPKPGDTFEGKYRIERRVGEGGFAQVFLAVQTGLERKVAIKVFDPNAALESGDHPGSGGSEDRSASDEVVPAPPVEVDEAANASSGPPPLPRPDGLPTPDADTSATGDDEPANKLTNLRSSLESLKRRRESREDTRRTTDKASPSALPRPTRSSKASSAEDEADGLVNPTPGSDASNGSLQSVVARFKREAQLISRLRSPYTVTIHDYGQTDDGILFMVMEYVDGVGFDQLELPLAPDRVANLMHQVLTSLREAHNIGVLHRDLKPANLMLFDHAGASDQVKLLDFGVAKLLRSQKKREKLEDDTDGDVLIGTPRYMSPEQILGVELDPASDVYSFGLVVYELITGQRAVDLEDEMQILAHHVRSESFELPADCDVPVALRRVVDKMLEKDLDFRYATADQVLSDLETLSTDSSEMARREDSGVAEMSQALKSRAVDLSDELKRSASSMSEIARSEGLLAALKARDSRTLLVLIAVFLLVGSVSMALIASIGDDARAGAEGSEVRRASEVSEKDAPEKPEPPAKVRPDDEPSEHQRVAAGPSDADAGDAGPQDHADAGADGGLVITRVLTDPPGADVFVGDAPLGESPVELDTSRFDFPVQLRAVSDRREAKMTIEKPGGEFTLELPEPQDEPKPDPEPKPPTFEFEPLE